MGNLDWLTSWVARAVLVPRVTTHSYGRGRGCFPPPRCLVRSWGLGFGHLRGTRSGDVGCNWAGGDQWGLVREGTYRKRSVSYGVEIPWSPVFQWVQKLLSTTRHLFRKLSEMPFFASVCLGSPEIGTVETNTHLITFASLYRRPISGCLREGGEVTALGIPNYRRNIWVSLNLGEDRDVESRG